MKTLRILLLCAAALGSTLLPARSQGTAFNYQGVLSQAGAAQNGPHDFAFTLHNAATDGQAVGTPNAVDGLRVADGVFTAILDFGPDAFVGQARWLHIAEGCNGVETLFTTFGASNVTNTVLTPLLLRDRVPPSQTAPVILQ